MRLLAESAVILAQRRAQAGHRDCSSYLYRFNSFPHNWTATPYCANYADWLLDESLGHSKGHLSRFYNFFDPAGESEDWKFWCARAVSSRHGESADSCPKLYLGVTPDQLPHALGMIGEALFKSIPIAIKLPRKKSVSLRPDKAIFYFDSFSHLEKCATLMSSMLPVYLKGQAVPFTRRWMNSGYLYIGVDPPKSTLDINSESWRRLVTHQLDININEALPLAVKNLDAFVAHVWDRMVASGFDLHQWAQV